MNSDRDLLLVALFTFLTVTMWVAFEFIKTSKTSTVSTTVQTVIAPINPSLDVDVLTQIKDKKVY